MVSNSDFIFHMCIPCNKAFSLVPRSRSFARVKVKYQGDILKKNDRHQGTSVSLRHLVSCFDHGNVNLYCLLIIHMCNNYLMNIDLSFILLILKVCAIKILTI